MYSHAEVARAPRRPRDGSSMAYVAINALAMPVTEIMTCCAGLSVIKNDLGRFRARTLR